MVIVCVLLCAVCCWLLEGCCLLRDVCLHVIAMRC